MPKYLLPILLLACLSVAWRGGGGYQQGIDASDVDADTTNFSSALSGADDTVQKALDTLDDAVSGGSVSDTAYGVGWNGDTTVAPSKNAVYDKIETISAGSGITRTIVVTSGNVTAGATASTDYVYLVAGAHTVTMPTAVGNTNLYKIKNNHSANITIDTTSAQTIDGTTSISIAPEESVDLISDGSNWRIQ